MAPSSADGVAASRAGAIGVQPARRRHATGELTFEVPELGNGPLALCLHGFPDSPYAGRHLLPELAEAGFHAVTPFMRGYAPTELPGDESYGRDALTNDALALHEALGGNEQAVLWDMTAR